MANSPVTTQVDYMGDAYPLTLRRVPRTSPTCYTWQLGHTDGCEGGCSMVTGREPVSDVEAAEQLARAYLRRTRPFGRLSPLGAIPAGRKVRIGKHQYVLLLRYGPRGLYGWSLYTTDGISLMHGADPVTGIDAAERLARVFMEQPTG